MQPSATARGDRPRLADLSPELRLIVEQTAIEEIETFGAQDSPARIERLAADGRASAVSDDEAGDMARWVSEAQEEIAARLRNQQAVLSLFGALGRVHRMAVAG